MDYYNSTIPSSDMERRVAASNARITNDRAAMIIVEHFCIGGSPGPFQLSEEEGRRHVQEALVDMAGVDLPDPEERLLGWNELVAFGNTDRPALEPGQVVFDVTREGCHQSLMYVKRQAMDLSTPEGREAFRRFNKEQGKVCK